MRIGVPTEIKTLEGRVAIVPGGVSALVADGHEVLVQRGAGLGSGITDEEFAQAGAKLLDTAEDVWTSAEMIVKVKEPLPAEYGYCRQRSDHLHVLPLRGGQGADRGDDRGRGGVLHLRDARDRRARCRCSRP